MHKYACVCVFVCLSYPFTADCFGALRWLLLSQWQHTSGNSFHPLYVQVLSLLAPLSQDERIVYTNSQKSSMCLLLLCLATVPQKSTLYLPAVWILMTEKSQQVGHTQKKVTLNVLGLAAAAFGCRRSCERWRTLTGESVYLVFVFFDVNWSSGLYILIQQHQMGKKITIFVNHKASLMTMCTSCLG